MELREAEWDSQVTNCEIHSLLKVFQNWFSHPMHANRWERFRCKPASKQAQTLCWIILVQLSQRNSPSWIQFRARFSSQILHLTLQRIHPLCLLRFSSHSKRFNSLEYLRYVVFHNFIHFWNWRDSPWFRLLLSVSVQFYSYQTMYHQNSCVHRISMLQSHSLLTV